jgi:hypothetical protein
VPKSNFKIGIFESDRPYCFAATVMLIAGAVVRVYAAHFLPTNWDEWHLIRFSTQSSLQSFFNPAHVLETSRPFNDLDGANADSIYGLFESGGHPMDPQAPIL